MYKTVREQLAESRPMTEDEVQEMLDDMHKRAKTRPMMFATKTKTNYPTNCYLCGTLWNITEICYGQKPCNIQQTIMVCDKCRKWLGEFLLSDQMQMTTPIPQEYE